MRKKSGFIIGLAMLLSNVIFGLSTDSTGHTNGISVGHYMPSEVLSEKILQINEAHQVEGRLGDVFIAGGRLRRLSDKYVDVSAVRGIQKYDNVIVAGVPGQAAPARNVGSPSGPRFESVSDDLYSSSVRSTLPTAVISEPTLYEAVGKEDEDARFLDTVRSVSFSR